MSHVHSFDQLIHHRITTSDPDIVITFERKSPTPDQPKGDRVVVQMVDSFWDSKTTLATLKGGKWEHPNPRSASVFWSLAKHNPRFKLAINHLSTQISPASYPQLSVDHYIRNLRCSVIKAKRRFGRLLKSVKFF